VINVDIKDIDMQQKARLSSLEKTLKTHASALEKRQLSYTTKTSEDDNPTEEAFKEGFTFKESIFGDP
jgi:hypothetical protein